MSDKHLSETEWKKFAKGRDLKDAGLLKSLGALDKASAVEQRLAALSEVDKQVAQLRKLAGKGDRELGAYLDNIDKAVAREQSAARAHEDEEDSPALLTATMAPLVRELRKGDVTMHALVTTAGKNTAVLIMRRVIPVSRRKMMADAVEAAGGAKHVAAECLFEAGALTFVMQGPAAGLAKRIREALHKQLDMRLKVRVRGEDGVADEDGEEGVDAELPGAAPGPAGAPSVGADSPPPSSARQAYDDALAALRERIDAALRQQHAQSSKLRAVETFANEKADAGDVAGALKALAMLTQLLDAPGAGQAPGASATSRASALEGWRTQRDMTVRMLKTLAAEAAASGEPEARAVVLEVSAVVKQLTAEPSTGQQVSELMTWLQNDDVVAEVDEFAEPVREPLMARLRDLQSAFAA